jgi:hypothetical protein
MAKWNRTATGSKLNLNAVHCQDLSGTGVKITFGIQVKEWRKTDHFKVTDCWKQISETTIY